MARFFSTTIGSSFLVAISYAKAVSIVSCASSALAWSMPTQMECSDELWVIRITLIFFDANASNSRLLNPGIPTIPLPSKLSSAMLLILEMPLVLLPSTAASSSLITVPLSSGANVFFIQVAMPLLRTGCMVGG